MRKLILTLIITVLYTISASGQDGLNTISAPPTIPFEISQKLQQENPVLSFDECAVIALITSYSIQDAELNLKQKYAGYVATRANLRSYVNLDMTLPDYKQETEDNYNDDTGQMEYFSIKKNEETSKLSFVQPLSSNGVISGNLYAERFEEDGETPEFTNRWNIGLNQPLFTPNKLQQNIYTSLLNLQNSKIDYIQKRVSLIYGYGFARSRRDDAVAAWMRAFGGGGGRGGGGGGRDRGPRGSLSNYYYTVYKDTRNLNLVQEKFDLLQEMTALAETRMNAGELPESEFLKLKVESSSSNSQLFSAQTAYSKSKRQLVQFLGLEADMEFDVIEEMEYVPVQIDKEHAISQGLANNTGIRGFLINIERDSLSLITTRENGHSEFKGNLSGTLGMNKSDDIFRLYYDEPNRSQTLKLNLSAPVWDRGRVGLAVNAKEVDYQQKKRQFANDIYDTRRQILGHLYMFEMMQERIELIRRARESASRALVIAKQQFETGEISTEDIILAVNKDFIAKQEYLNLLMDYKSTLIEIANQTQWDFEKNKSIREEIEKLIEEII
jgi:outer membrane protein TolC